MFLSALLSNKGFVPIIRTTATVHLEAGPTITLIELNTEAEVPGCDEATFQQLAEDAKKGCPVSKALAGPEITLKAKLVNSSGCRIDSVWGRSADRQARSAFVGKVVITTQLAD